MSRYSDAVRQGLALARQRAIRLNAELFAQFATFHAAGWGNSRRPVNLAARLARLVENYDLTFNRPQPPRSNHEED